MDGCDDVEARLSSPTLKCRSVVQPYTQRCTSSYAPHKELDAHSSVSGGRRFLSCGHRLVLFSISGILVASISSIASVLPRAWIESDLADAIALELGSLFLLLIGRFRLFLTICGNKVLKPNGRSAVSWLMSPPLY